MKRLRPKFMTAAMTFVGLALIVWSAASRSDVVKRIAASLIEGIFPSFMTELLVYPPFYEVRSS